MGKEGRISGGVFDHSTHEEDGPGTWEALASPRRIPVFRRAGDPSPTHGMYAGTRVVGPFRAQNKRPQRGRPRARGTGAVAEGGSNCLVCQGLLVSFYTFFPRLGCQVLRCLTMALRMVNNLRIHAVSATFLTFPADNKRW